MRRSAKLATDALLRRQVIELLEARQAHLDPETVLRRFPAKFRGVTPRGLPYSAWQLLEHMRLAQWDILEFSRNPKHVSPDWPEGYWPKSEAPPSPRAWGASVRGFLRDLREMKRMVANPRTDLFARMPHGSGQTILREAMLAADHNSYHTGQIVILARLIQARVPR
jgi:hypothetical protein